MINFTIYFSHISRIIILLVFWVNANAQGLGFSLFTGSCNTPGYECTIFLPGAGSAWFQPKLIERTRSGWAAHNNTTEIIAFYSNNPLGYTQSYVENIVYKKIIEITAKYPGKKINFVTSSLGYPALVKLSTLIREKGDIPHIGKIVINQPTIINSPMFSLTNSYSSSTITVLDFGDALIDQVYYFKAPDLATSSRFGEPSELEIKGKAGQKIDFFSIEMPVFEIHRKHSWFSWFDGDVNYNRILSPSGAFNKHVNALGRGEYITGSILRGRDFQEIKYYISDMVFYNSEMSKNVGLHYENVKIPLHKESNDKYRHVNDNSQQFHSIPSTKIIIEKPKPPITKRDDIYDDQIRVVQNNNKFPPPPPGGVTFEKMATDSTASFKKDPSLSKLKENLLKKPHQ
ncbi:MAG: hypothetical protein JNK77_00625 [Saprospiraceae bacterium]|nr:hypothetical protein [Saprospiraceae bacterium]